jgi:hypothetical protein
VEGSVRKSGNQLGITAQAIDAAKGYHLWSEAFRREMSDVVAIQEEISIVEAYAGFLRALCLLHQQLLAVLTGHRADSDLDLYERLRRPAAASVLGLAAFLTSLATVRGGGKRAVRNVLLSLIAKFPPLRNRLLMNLSGLSRNALAVVAEPASKRSQASE